MTQSFDPAVVEALESAAGHVLPLEDSEWPEIRELVVQHARDLAGIERCIGLTMLFVLGCDPVDSGFVSQFTSLSTLQVNDSGLTCLESMNDLPLIQCNLNRNLITDLTPLLDLHDLTSLDIIGNPLTAESYEEVLPELRSRGMYITWSERSDWELTVRLQEAGLPFICYRNQNVLRLGSPGFHHVKVPDAGHSAVTENELREALDEDPQRVYQLFERGEGLWSPG
ncbi:hypothetical protein NMG29_39550 [Streptomyces cocklensis]|uniref:Leucine-rich repeat domain-containing protein n=1 Tax=Actinacidiphila cocklensis TaxID=887465 RepID=A0A9W4DV88_9ACTN|nr:hypothetical protein [Actinacidiphila cocklensis]MDD1064171.1 hypothetical protein [Actinacidiphila cocklensis]CAG6398310.1 conserved hypothetical protein [Actinacidiphila cocklensis]